MSLYSTMYTSVTGLQTTSQELGVVSDNIANANTIGFKQSRASFSDIMGANLGSQGQLGLGARLQAVQKILTQGALTSTGLATDLALQGPGFFMVAMPDGQTAYTRAGQFTIDNEGFLVNLDGLRVQGYQATADGTVGGALGNLLVGEASTPPQATESVEFAGNLDASAVDSGIAYDPNDPDSYEFSTSTVLYDSLGNAVSATIHYKKTANPGEWETHVVVDGANQQGGTAGVLTEVDSGTLTFDTDGNLTAQAMTGAPGFLPVGATQPQPVTYAFDDMTQYAGPSAMSFISQDGFAAGELANIRIENDGTIMGAFTNGESRALGQVAVADFSAADQLERVGGNLFRATRGAGEPVFGAPGTGGRGSIVAGALELSNVDIASEFVRMIVAQRGFQANSKAITTVDTLLGELMQLKR
jgi:flagellar hook protein FlgE